MHSVRARELSLLLARAVTAVWHHAGLGAIADEEGGWAPAGVGAATGICLPSTSISHKSSIGRSDAGQTSALRWLGPAGSGGDNEDAEASALRQGRGGAQAAFNTAFNRPKGLDSTRSRSTRGASLRGSSGGDVGADNIDEMYVGSDSDAEASDDSSNVVLSPTQVSKSRYYNQLYQQIPQIRSRSRTITKNHITQRERQVSIAQAPHHRASQSGSPGNYFSEQRNSGAGRMSVDGRVEKGETLIERVARLASAAGASSGMGNYGARSIFRADDVFPSSSDEWESEEWESDEGWVQEGPEVFWMQEGDDTVEKGDNEMVIAREATEKVTGVNGEVEGHAKETGAPESGVSEVSKVPDARIPPAPIIEGLNDKVTVKANVPPAPAFADIFGAGAPVPALATVAKSGIPPSPNLSGHAGIPAPPSLASLGLGIPQPPNLSGLNIPPPPALSGFGITKIPAPSMQIPKAPWERLGMHPPATITGNVKGLRRLHWEVIADVDRAVGKIQSGKPELESRGKKGKSVRQLLLRALRVCTNVHSHDQIDELNTDTIELSDEASSAATGPRTSAAIASYTLAAHALRLKSEVKPVADVRESSSTADGNEIPVTETNDKVTVKEDANGDAVDTLWRRVQLLRVADAAPEVPTEAKSKVPDKAHILNKAPFMAWDEDEKAVVGGTEAYLEAKKSPNDTRPHISVVVDDEGISNCNPSVSHIASTAPSLTRLIDPLLREMPRHVAQYCVSVLAALPAPVAEEACELAVLSTATLISENVWVATAASAERPQKCRPSCGLDSDDGLLAQQCLQARGKRIDIEVDEKEPLFTDIWADVDDMVKNTLSVDRNLDKSEVVDNMLSILSAALARAWSLPYLREAKVNATKKQHESESTSRTDVAHESSDSEVDTVSDRLESSPEHQEHLLTATHPRVCQCAAKWVAAQRTLLLSGLLHRAAAAQRRKSLGTVLSNGAPAAAQVLLAFDVDKARARRDQAKKRDAVAKASKDEAVSRSCICRKI